MYYWRVHYTAGREPVSFYVMRTRVSESGDHIWLYIDYSSDYGQTFTTWFHDLDSLYTSVQSIKKPEPQLIAYPNPFNTSTTIEFELDISGHVVLYLYDVFGFEIKTLIDEKRTAGRHSVVWHGQNSLGNAVPGGIYFLQMNVGDLVQTRQLLLQK